MSFSSDVKEQLSKLANLSNKENVKQELIGYLLSSNIAFSKTMIRFSTENEYNINRFSKLLSNCKILDYKTEIKDKNYIIKFRKKDIEETLQDFIQITEEHIELTEKEYETLKMFENQGEAPLKALIRGMFLGAGAINNPQKCNQLSIGAGGEKIANKVVEYLQQNNIEYKTIRKRKNYYIYTNNGEEISKLLAFIGGNKAVLEFENARLEREMRNKINRMVNCETANLNKTMNASIEQIEAINKLKTKRKLGKLDKELKEVAEIRLKNPNASLIEIGKMLKDPIGKSGVNYRLKKIIEIARNI